MLPRLLTMTVMLLLLAAPAAAQAPQTGFEQRDGASFTTHEEEVAFLTAVAAGSPRVRLSVAGTTRQGRPLHLVELGAPGPAGAAAARSRPTALMVCSQHGNEPAGREACLKLLRDLAFTTDANLVALLQSATFLFVPSANPDGRAGNTRENTDGVDVNRDHLGLDTPEARAMARIVLDYQPDVAIDLHEYGPSQPVLYDDAVLWLWPRNLNTDAQVHDLAIEMGRRYLEPAAQTAGYGTDEYGQYEVADNDVAQTAGDDDEGIMRNAMGLRHVLGILVETRVDADVRQDPMEVVEQARVNRRRVASHGAVLQGMLAFMRERGPQAAQVTAAAMQRKAAEGAAQSAPLYFDGADNQEPPASAVVNPPPCGYALTPDQVAALGPRLELHGIELFTGPAGPFVSLAQAAEPVIPLLLDARGARAKSDAKPVMGDCPAPPRVLSPAEPARRPQAPAAKRCVRRRSYPMRLPRRRGRALTTRVRMNGRPVRVRRGVAVLPLKRFKRGATVRVRIEQRVRRGGRTRTHRTTRTLRLC